MNEGINTLTDFISVGSLCSKLSHFLLHELHNPDNMISSFPPKALGSVEGSFGDGPKDPYPLSLIATSICSALLPSPQPGSHKKGWYVASKKRPPCGSVAWFCFLDHQLWGMPLSGCEWSCREVSVKRH